MSGASPARERLETYGAASCSDAEIVSTLVGCTEEKAAALLVAVGGISGLASATTKELQDAGIGRASAGRLCAAVALARRVAAGGPYRESVRKPADLAALLRGRFAGEQREVFVAVGLDARQRVILVHTVAIGSLAQVDVHPRELFRPILRAGCHTVIVAHNHPSGDAEPSHADIALTRRLVEAGKLLGIAVLDHLVVTENGYASHAELGLMGGES